MRLHSLFSTLLTLALVACGGGSGPAGPGNPAPASTVQSAGLVVDDQGVPLAGATVTVVSASSVPGTDAAASTGADGRFALTLDAATPAVLKVQKAGYASSFRAAAVASDNATVADRVLLLPVASSQTFDPTQAAVLRVPGSPARVDLAAGSLVREDGQAISGTASVALTPIDPSADIGQMPGLMVDAASGVPIESLGALTIEFTDASGARLNLASGQTATVRIPATPAAGATPPATFPLYHLNETTGRWTQEGTATLQTDPATGAMYYEGTVTHFSTWNADRVIERAGVNFNAVQGGGVCVVPAGLRVVSRGVDYNGETTLIEAGRLVARAGSRVEVLLINADGQLLDAVTLDTGAPGSTTVLPRCLAEPPLVSVSGRVTVTSGRLDDHRVQISGRLLRPRTVSIAADGGYSLAVHAGIGPLQARLVSGVDRGTPPTTVTATVSAANAVFPDLTVSDARFELPVCVQGWDRYRHTSAQVGLFRDGLPLGDPATVRAVAASVTFERVPLNSTLTLRLTAPDATLVERSVTLVVGSTPPAPPACLTLPVAAQADLQVSGDGLTRVFDASGSTAGDAPITAYAWSFGDGGTATGAVTSHGYAATGSYVVSLRVTDALGQVSQAQRTVVVTGGGALSVLTPASALDAGTNHSCAVRSNGVWCWGDNFHQQLGSPITVDTSTEPYTYTGLMSSGVPMQISGLSHVTAVSAGESHSCALHANGTVSCWGNGDYGQLGQGSRDGSATPVVVSGLNTALAVSAGGFSTCALLQGGSVSCWGNSNTSIEQLVPAPVVGLSGVTALASGYGHHCAVLDDGGVRCWGDNHDGQLGNGSTTDSASPVAVSGIANAVAVVTGSRHSCALLADGSVRCWGYRGISGGFGTVRSGLMGDGGTSVSPALTPVTVSGISTAVALVTGTSHTCALLQDASVWCWGAGGYARGQTDPGAVALSPEPVGINGAVNALALGGGHTCVSLASGGVQCLGSGGRGQLGTGGQSNEQNPNPSPYPEFSITPLTVLFP